MYAPFTAEHAHAKIRQLRVEAEHARAAALARASGAARRSTTDDVRSLPEPVREPALLADEAGADLVVNLPRQPRESVGAAGRP
jgi:hypothetical protein